MRYETKEFICSLLISIIGIIIAYTITSLLDIKNIILYESLSATGFMITYEVLIWWALVLPVAFIYEYIQKKEQEI